MMKKRLQLAVMVLFGLLISTVNFAQDAKPAKSDLNILTGFYNNTDVGLLAGSSKNNLKAPFSFMSVTGYHITEQFAVGLGIGADFLEETYIPIVMDVRYYFRKSSFSPFAFIQGGYSIATGGVIDAPNYPVLWDFFPNWIWGYPPTAKSTGGFLINPGVGIRKMFSNNFGLTFSVSYRYQRFNYNVEDDGRLELDYNRMNFRIGIIFK
jgi:hypothetical protein